MRLLIPLAILSSTPVLALAQQGLPAPVTQGLESLTGGDCKAAFELWTSTWTAPEESEKRRTLVNGCQIIERFGWLRGYDVVKVVNVTPHLMRVYAVLLYDPQPVYILVVAYRPASTWKVVSLNWNTLVEKVFPPDLLPAEHFGQ